MSRPHHSERLRARAAERIPGDNRLYAIYEQIVPEPFICTPDLYQVSGTGGGVLYVYDPYLTAAPEGTELVDLPTLLARSDVVSVHAPLTEGTKGLLDAEVFASMRQDSRDSQQQDRRSAACRIPDNSMSGG